MVPRLITHRLRIQHRLKIRSRMILSRKIHKQPMEKLARKAESEDYYKKALSAAEQSDELLRRLSDAKKSVFVKASDTEDEQAREDYQTEAVKDIAGFLNSYNTMISNLMEAGGEASQR